MNLLPAGTMAGKLVLAGRTLPLAAAEATATAGFRPEHLRLADPDGAHLAGRIEVVEEFGEHALIHFEADSAGPVTVKADGAPDLRAGQRIGVTLMPEHLHLFDSAGRALVAG